MNNSLVSSTFLLGENLENFLFKTAVQFAESGLNVWFISQKPFKELPENISQPEKEVLQLITFMYLNDYKDLINHLNTTHLWHKTPNVIIVSNFEKYSRLYEENYNSLFGAHISTSLLDSAAVCAKKTGKLTKLITTCSLNENFKEKLKIFNDLYFPVMLKKSDTTELVNDFLTKIKP